MPTFDEVRFYGTRLDLPDNFPSNLIAVVGTRENHKWSIFLCPCGRGHRIELNMQRSRWPAWRLSIGAGLPTLRPSVDSHQDDFRCHFVIFRGRTEWVPGRRRPNRWPRVRPSNR